MVQLVPPFVVFIAFIVLLPQINPVLEFKNCISLTETKPEPILRLIVENVSPPSVVFLILPPSSILDCVARNPVFASKNHAEFILLDPPDSNKFSVTPAWELINQLSPPSDDFINTPYSPTA